MVHSMKVFFMCVILAFGISDAVVTTYSGDTVKIVLHPPTNLTVYFINETDAFIVWTAPWNYPIHDYNETDTDMDNETVDTTTETAHVTLPPATPGNVPKTTHNSSSGEVVKGDNSSKSGAKKVQCMPHSFFVHNVTKENNTETGEPEVTINFVNGSSIQINQTNVTGQIVVPFDQGCLEQYVVYYTNTKTGKTSTVIVPADNETEVHLKNLKANYSYTVFVSAEFTSGDILNSSSINITTKASPKERECHCDYHGTLHRERQCNLTLFPWCICKEGYSGIFCETCAHGFYRSAPYFPCNRCPCSPYATTQLTCHFREGYLVCDSCSNRYTGHLCQSCAPGFWRHHRRCIPCFCHGNSDPKVTSMCDPMSGACLKCIHNTEGISCERCIKGYVGDPIHHKNCTAESEVQKNMGPSTGVIAAICIGIILVLSGIVGFAVYRHWKVFPPRKPFWTVELKEDHDSVNFSAVPEHDYQNIDAAGVEDLEFYEKHGGRSSGKEVSRYAPLTEDI